MVSKYSSIQALRLACASILFFTAFGCGDSTASMEDLAIASGGFAAVGESVTYVCPDASTLTLAVIGLQTVWQGFVTGNNGTRTLAQSNIVSSSTQPKACEGLGLCSLTGVASFLNQYYSCFYHSVNQDPTKGGGDIELKVKLLGTCAIPEENGCSQYNTYKACTLTCSIY